MNATALLLLIVGLSLISFFTARQKAMGYRSQIQFKALPKHYGYMTALWSGLPALILIIAWAVIKPAYMHDQIMGALPASIMGQPQDTIELYINSINLAIANGESSDDPIMQAAIDRYHEANSTTNWLITALVLLLGLSGIIFGMSSALTRVQARVKVEKTIKVILLVCSGVAIVTTVGIVLSVLFEALRFFEAVSVFDFMFGTNRGLRAPGRAKHEIEDRDRFEKTQRFE